MTAAAAPPDGNANGDGRTQRRRTDTQETGDGRGSAAKGPCCQAGAIAGTGQRSCYSVGMEPGRARESEQKPARIIPKTPRPQRAESPPASTSAARETCRGVYSGDRPLGQSPAPHWRAARVAPVTAGPRCTAGRRRLVDSRLWQPAAAQ